jgi:hypothetical protein|tara:strand:- start:12051 stop:12263 length:213 start_codon:yes stop_codon:yes gene_type:complete
MKSKNYILMQMKNILIDRKEYSEEKAEAWVRDHETKTVYELMVMKKHLTTVEEECRDVSCRSSIWCDEEY